MNKYILFICIFCAGIVTLFIGTYSRLVKSVAQENRLPVISAMLRLHIGNHEMVKVNLFKNGNGVITNAFIVRTKAGHRPIIQYMEERGWEFEEQVGSSLHFKKDSGRVTVGYQQIITKDYRLIEI